jgi:hypothetical protein
VGRQLEVSLLGDLPFSDFHICLGISYIRRILEKSQVVFKIE